jgi:uncharacterized protein YjbJ (UPF0337 family)
MSTYPAHYNQNPQNPSLKLLSAILSSDTGNRQQATGNRQQATGNRQQATGNRQQATGNRQHYTHLLNNRVKTLTFVSVQSDLKSADLKSDLSQLSQNSSYPSQAIYYVTAYISPTFLIFSPHLWITGGTDFPEEVQFHFYYTFVECVYFMRLLGIEQSNN